MPTITYPWTLQVWGRDARSWTTSRACDRCRTPNGDAWHPLLAIAAVDNESYVAMRCPQAPRLGNGIEGVQIQIAIVREAKSAHQKAARLAAIPLLEAAWDEPAIQLAQWKPPPLAPALPPIPMSDPSYGYAKGPDFDTLRSTVLVDPKENRRPGRRVNPPAPTPSTAVGERVFLDDP